LSNNNNFRTIERERLSCDQLFGGDYKIKQINEQFKHIDTLQLPDHEGHGSACIHGIFSRKPNHQQLHGKFSHCTPKRTFFQQINITQQIILLQKREYHHYKTSPHLELSVTNKKQLIFAHNQQNNKNKQIDKQESNKFIPH
jgi:hypothetical protein